MRSGASRGLSSWVLIAHSLQFSQSLLTSPRVEEGRVLLCQIINQAERRCWPP